MLCHIDDIRMFLSRWIYQNVMTLLRKYLNCQKPKKISTPSLISKLFLYGMTFPELALQYFLRRWLLNEYSKVK